METTYKSHLRTYQLSESCVFRKTKDKFGGLSNMASGFPIRILNSYILTSEALYQACRFPHLPHVQKKIIEQKSPMSSKMVSKPFRKDTRIDWDKSRVEIMYWCLKVKLAQNFLTFGQLLETTSEKPIVEDSNKDPFWGAIKDKESGITLTGINALGRLLMKLRQEYNSEKRFNLLYVEPLPIPNFFLLEEQIPIIDERENFINYLYKYWRINPLSSFPNNEKQYYSDSKLPDKISLVSESEQIFNAETTNKNTGKKTNLKKKTDEQTEMFSLFDRLP